MRDLTDPRLLYLKAGLFVLLGVTAAVLLLAESPRVGTLLLLGLCVWAFARAYYFAFYVLEKYIDPRLRFSGVFTTVSHLLHARLIGSPDNLKEVRIMGTKDVADQLVSLCREGKNLEAIEKLYSDDIVSVEAAGPPEMPLEMRGKDAIRGKNEWWFNSNTLHSASAEGPFVNGDKFAVIYDYDITSNEGPRKGERFKMKEVAVYTVADDKVVHEQFLY
jgi:ketosteroid isomerase-like protein